MQGMSISLYSFRRLSGTNSRNTMETSNAGYVLPPGSEEQCLRTHVFDRLPIGIWLTMVRNRMMNWTGFCSEPGKKFLSLTFHYYSYIWTTSIYCNRTYPLQILLKDRKPNLQGRLPIPGCELLCYYALWLVYGMKPFGNFSFSCQNTVLLSMLFCCHQRHRESFWEPRACQIYEEEKTHPPVRVW